MAKLTTGIVRLSMLTSLQPRKKQRRVKRAHENVRETR